MVDAVLARTGLPSLKVGSPTLSIVEAAAQSDLRSSQDVFNLLNSLSLDRATGVALDRLAADEGLIRVGANASQGYVNITDSRYTKIATRIYQGGSAVLIGSTSITVESAVGFLDTGSLYIGRGLAAVEGPISIGTITGSGPYVITLDTPTTRFHNVGETVTYAQGGNRIVSAGTNIATPTGVGTPVTVQTASLATLPDGEVTLTQIPCRATAAGSVTNSVANSLTTFTTAPFTGATVTNPLPFSGGTDTETDQALRERIRVIRQTRARGTALAITTGVQGITSPDEGGRILSASLLARVGETPTLHIDDGTGYQEKSAGQPYEVLATDASGGEKHFSLALGRPVVKAVVQSLQAPWSGLVDSWLAVKVAGLVSEHKFSVDDFLHSDAATAYEVASSINSDSTLAWGAIVLDSGTRIGIRAKADTDESVQVSTPSNSPDANSILGLSDVSQETLWLYKDDALLSKDGRAAVVTTLPQAQWIALPAGPHLTLKVDNSPTVLSVTATNADFVSAGTGYTLAASTNSLASWAAVWNYLLPGVTCSAQGAALAFTSNLGHNSRAAIVITGGSFLGIFDTTTSYGVSGDYNLDRNLGLIKLETALAAGEKLTAGSEAFRAHVDSPSFTSVVIPSVATSVTGDLGAEVWVGIDSGATQVAVTVGVGSTVTAARPGGGITTYTLASAFSNVAVGDWVVITDSALSLSNRGAYQVTSATANAIGVFAANGAADGAVVLAEGGFRVWRMVGFPQRLFATTATYSPTQLAAAFDTMVGGNAEVYRTTHVRLRTGKTSGDFAVLGYNSAGASLGWVVGDAISSGAPHRASAIGYTGIGTPTFDTGVVNVPGTSSFSLTGLTVDGNQLLVGLRREAAVIGGNIKYSTGISYEAAGVYNFRTPPLQPWVATDRIYAANPYLLSARDRLAITIDGDVVSRAHVFNTYRKVTPVSGTYTASGVFTDADNGALALSKAFGNSFSWNDFALHMKARTLGGGILWRYYRHGPEGNNARLQYSYPAAPSANVSVSTDARTNTTTDISVTLGASAARTLVNPPRNTTYVGLCRASAGATNNITYSLALTASSGVRAAGTTALTLTLPTGVTNHGIQINDVIYVQSTDGNFTSGPKVVTGRTGTQLAYAEALVDVGPIVPATVRISRDPVGFTDWNGAILGDIINFGAGTALAAHTTGPFKTTVVNPAYDYVSAYVPTSSTGETIQWRAMNVANVLSVYPLDAPKNATAAIVASVGTTGVVSGTEITPGIITDATYETAGWYLLTDGINWVKTTTVGAGPTYAVTLDLKDSPTVAHGNWSNDDVRLVPTTTANVSDFLNSLATSGLASGAEVTVTADNKPQVMTLTTGSFGSVAIEGGTANTLAAALVGSGSSASTSGVVAARTSDVEGLVGNSWVELRNASVLEKSILTNATTITWTAGGLITFGTDYAWKYAGTTGAAVSKTFQVERQGKFVAYVNQDAGITNFSTVKEGDWVALVGGTMALPNLGYFRIVRIESSTKTFWVVNDSAIEESGVTTDATFIDYDSVLPGDVFAVGGTALGHDRVGSWSVASIDLSNRYKFTVTGSWTGSVGPITPGSLYTLYRIAEGSPTSLYKRITGISPGSSNLTDIKFDTSEKVTRIGAAAGTVLVAQDRLGLGLDSIGNPLPASVGLDGYRFHTGLLAEANKVVYGDEAGASTYPGIAAAGASINISGPIVKRITVALALRIRTGTSAPDIANQAKSRVAALVNNSPVGTDIAISDVVATVQAVNGVQAVTVLSPVYNSGHDLIAVQPDEKPLILDGDRDVTVSFVGA